MAKDRKIINQVIDQYHFVFIQTMVLFFYVYSDSILLLKDDSKYAKLIFFPINFFNDDRILGIINGMKNHNSNSH